MELMNIVNRWYNNEDISMEDIHALAYADLSEYDDQAFSLIVDMFYDIMECLGESYDEYDTEYPNDTYHYGYIINDNVFITGYTGIAGAYWRNSQEWAICKW